MIVGGSLCRALLELGESPITNGDGDCGGGGDVDFDGDECDVDGCRLLMMMAVFNLKVMVELMLEVMLMVMLGVMASPAHRH